MKPIQALLLAAATASLIFVGCETTSSSTKASAEPPPSVDTTSTGSTNAAPVDASATTPPGEDTSSATIPLDKLPKKKGYPYAIKTKWAGVVRSPYAQDKFVNVEGHPAGTPVRCPHTGKIFIVP